MEIDKILVHKRARKKRLSSVIFIVIAIIAGLYVSEYQQDQTSADPPASTSGPTIEQTNPAFTQYKTAAEGLNALAIKGRAAKTGYTRSQFGNGWEESGGCDTRNRILARDLINIIYAVNSCVVQSGLLNDPYTGKTIQFQRGQDTSDDVQIDHVVALSDAWQKGAQLLSFTLREQLANDGLNLLAVDGAANQNKSDGDAATWLPSNKAIRCSYVARQVTVKLKYSLWVTSAEKTAIQDILKTCPDQKLVN